MPSASREYDNSNKDSTKLEYFKNQNDSFHHSTFTHIMQSTFIKIQSSDVLIVITCEITKLLCKISHRLQTARAVQYCVNTCKARM